MYICTMNILPLMKSHTHVIAFRVRLTYHKNRDGHMHTKFQSHTLIYTYRLTPQKGLSCANSASRPMVDVSLFNIYLLVSTHTCENVRVKMWNIKKNELAHVRRLCTFASHVHKKKSSVVVTLHSPPPHIRYLGVSNSQGRHIYIYVCISVCVFEHMHSNVYFYTPILDIWVSQNQTYFFYVHVYISVHPC